MFYDDLKQRHEKAILQNHTIAYADVNTEYIIAVDDTHSISKELLASSILQILLAEAAL